jgi:drug/metabolite transporter (DMT)-like permease
VLRIAGYWLLYAVVGVLVLLMLAVGGGDLGSEDAKSPIRQNTKVIGAINGLAIGCALVGLYLTRDPTASRTPAMALLYGGGAAAALFGIWAWVRIAGDLKTRRKRR